MEHRFKRLWTREEAEAILPRVKLLLREIQADAQKLESVHSLLETVNTTAGGNGHSTKAEGAVIDMESIESHLSALLEQFAEWGIEIKDPRTGLIDFPHERNGRVVYLCWKLGEDHIRFWHELDTGFAGRKPLD